MKAKRTLIGIVALLSVCFASAQSDGGRFDAAVVLTPGMTLKRGAVFMTGGYQNTLLTHGDTLQTDSWMSGSYYILTSDGTVIGMARGTTMVIDGRRIGFDVFRVMDGSAAILGNINNGYPMPPEFRRLLPFRYGNVIVHPNPDSFEYPIFAVPQSFSPVRR